MSEPDNFLSRWSRRKQEVARQEAQTDTPPPATESQDARTLKEAKGPSSDNAAPPPAIDLAKLPSLDEITADTDITGFLKPGVPAGLARAALRRAWTSDPAVRDFVGLQENDWVFNKPGPAEGFGPIGPESDVRQMLARVFGDPTESKSAPDSVENAAAAPEPSEKRKDVAVTRPPPDPSEVIVQRNNEEPASPDVAPRRSHGGALPMPGSET
jgi:hypothetical protein